MLWIQRHSLGEMVQGRFEFLNPNIEREQVGALDLALEGMSLGGGAAEGEGQVQAIPREQVEMMHMDSHKATSSA